jgi:hypothetical protein
MTTLMSTPQIVTVESLAERCDSCGAAAKIEVSLSSGGGLAFCGHHANRHAGELARLAGEVRLEDGFQWAGKVRAQ